MLRVPEEPYYSRDYLPATNLSNGARSRTLVKRIEEGIR
jgi:hypothetical protein